MLEFDRPDAAESALNRLRRLQQLIRIVDAAVVTWPPDRKAPKTMQAAESDTAGIGDAVADRVIPELKDLNPELVATNLTRDQETKLREVFAEAQ